MEFEHLHGPSSSEIEGSTDSSKVDATVDIMDPTGFTSAQIDPSSFERVLDILERTIILGGSAGLDEDLREVSTITPFCFGIMYDPTLEATDDALDERGSSLFRSMDLFAQNNILEA
jgi:hypothetical protein